jgi:hypothetical protein
MNITTTEKIFINSNVNKINSLLKDIENYKKLYPSFVKDIKCVPDVKDEANITIKVDDKEIKSKAKIEDLNENQSTIVITPENDRVKKIVIHNKYYQKDKGVEVENTLSMEADVPFFMKGVLKEKAIKTQHFILQQFKSALECE